jgi:hypothetical protein
MSRREIVSAALLGILGSSTGPGYGYRRGQALRPGLRRAMVFSDSGQSIEGRFYRDNKIYPGLAAFADLGCTSFLAEAFTSKPASKISIVFGSGDRDSY